MISLAEASGLCCLHASSGKAASTVRIRCIRRSSSAQHLSTLVAYRIAAVTWPVRIDLHILVAPADSPRLRGVARGAGEEVHKRQRRTFLA